MSANAKAFLGFCLLMLALPLLFSMHAEAQITCPYGGPFFKTAPLCTANCPGLCKNLGYTSSFCTPNYRCMCYKLCGT